LVFIEYLLLTIKQIIIMKKNNLYAALVATLVVFASVTFLLSCGKEEAKSSNAKDIATLSTRTGADVTYTFEYVENHLVFYKHVGDIIKEYFLVQRETAPLTTNFQNITGVVITDNGTKLTVSFNNQSPVVFSTVGAPGTLPSAGIVTSTNEGGFSIQVVRDDILSYGQGPAGGGPSGGGGKRCKDCLDGGCGSTSCSRSIEVMGVKKSCSTTCATGYHACCGDLVAVGCFCQKDICCK
jgi:hypothetical protein